MNNTIGGYQDDGRGHYNFSFSDNDGKHISVGFRAEPDWDLNVVFQEFRNFLIASGHDVENDIGEIHAYDESDEDDDEPAVLARWTEDYENEMAKQYQTDKFTMDHLPKNGWPFGGLTTTPLPALTSVDLSSISSQSFSGWSGVNEFPTMAPLQSMDLRSLTSADIAAWTVPAPGTIGGATVSFPIPGPNGSGGIFK
jgi:hypothetical protein